jgi:hypothetical protein
MSYAEQLHKLAAVECHLAQACLDLDPDPMDGEVFDITLEPLLDQL